MTTGTVMNIATTTAAVKLLILLLLIIIVIMVIIIIIIMIIAAAATIIITATTASIPSQTPSSQSLPLLPHLPFYLGLTLIFSSNSPALHSVYSMIQHHPSVPLLNAGAAVSAALGMILFGDAIQVIKRGPFWLLLILLLRRRRRLLLLLLLLLLLPFPPAPLQKLKHPLPPKPRRTYKESPGYRHHHPLYEASFCPPHPYPATPVSQAIAPCKPDTTTLLSGGSLSTVEKKREATIAGIELGEASSTTTTTTITTITLSSFPTILQQWSSLLTWRVFPLPLPYHHHHHHQVYGRP